MQDAFEDWMDERAREVQGQWFDGKVAGMTWSNPDGSSRQEIARTLLPCDELMLVAEPDNPYDANAVAVFTADGAQVGYLEARLARELTLRWKRCIETRCFVRALRQRGDIAGVSFGLLQWQA